MPQQQVHPEPANNLGPGAYDFEAPPPVDLNELHLEDHGQTWKTIFYEPSTRWRSRLCSIYLHIAAALMCFATDTSACEVPLGLWLGIQFILLILEGFTIEMRERMRESIYWNENRR